MFKFCGNLFIFELLLLWTLVSPSPKQTKTFAKGTARTNIDLGFFEHNTCADKLQVIMCFRLLQFGIYDRVEVFLFWFRNILRRFLRMTH